MWLELSGLFFTSCSVPSPLLRGWRRVPRVDNYAAEWGWGWGGACLWIWQEYVQQLIGGVYASFVAIS